jgi:hypothetical protein
MAQALYKWTGQITTPSEYDSALAAPVWYGNNGDTGYAFLDTAFAALCTSSNDDLATTTDAADKAWVKNNSAAARLIKDRCQEAIRAQYNIEDELKALRTSDTTVQTAIAAIVAPFSAELDALVGD